MFAKSIRLRLAALITLSVCVVVASAVEFGPSVLADRAEPRPLSAVSNYPNRAAVPMARTIWTTGEQDVASAQMAENKDRRLEGLEAAGVFSPSSVFTNSSAVTIPSVPSAIANKPASPYPSNIVVSGLSGNISAMTLKLNGFHHTQQKDIDMLLVGPTGATFVFMSDLGGSNSASAFDLTFSDAAASQAPNTAITAAGTYQPANYVQTNDGTPTTDSFDAPAPAPSYNHAAPTGAATFTSVFGGTNPNGTWSLYIMDDTGGDSGALDGGWTLDITPSVSAVPTTTTVVSSINPSLTTQSPVFTATVVKSSDSSPATGTVTFVDQTTSTTLASNVALNGSGQASTGAIAGLPERRHTIVATFNPNASFLGSNASITQTVDFPTTNPSAGMWCNTNSISVPEPPATAGTAVQYPSHITVTGATGTISHMVVTLKNVTANSSPDDLDILLVGPGGQKFILVSDAGGATLVSNVTLNVDDTAGTFLPDTGGWGAANSTVNTKPVDYQTGETLPAPAPAGPYNTPVITGGTSTIDGIYGGTTPNGVWSLYLNDDVGGDTEVVAGGWCLSFTTSSDPATTTTVTSSLNPSNPGQSVTFTATVLKTSDNSPVTTGTVNFLDGATPLAGPLSLNGSGQATYTTSTLTVGTHPIIVNYSGVAGTFGPSNGSVNQTVDAPTTNPAYGTYCNASSVGIPLVGIANPYASNINIPSFPGTLNKVTVQLKTMSHTSPTDVDVLLVGPAGQKVLLLSDAGGATDISNQDLTFDDAAAGSVPSPIVTGTYKPTDVNTGADSFPAPAPASPYSSLLSAFSSTLPTGAWSLYVVDDTGGDQGSIAGGWCVNLVANPVTGTGTTSHTGPAPANHMRQGGTGTVSFSLLNNGNGPTSDPDQSVAHAMTVTGPLPAGLTLGTVPTGSPWNCTANTTTQFTCTNLGSIAQGSSYQLLTIPVNVASNAPASVTVSGVTFSGAGMTAGTFASDTITVDSAPLLSISKSQFGTFTQGAAAQWNIAVSNVAAATGLTDGSTVTVRDPIPSGYTITSVVSGNEWNCTSTTSTVLLCTTTNVLAGGASYSTISVHVTVGAASPTSVTNTASVWGGGDLVHTSQGTAATGSSTVTVVQTPATIQLTSGNNQSVAVNTAFPTNLSVTVLDAGNVPISGATVTFTAPATGASGTFAGGTNVKTAVSNASGVATATVYTANSTAGVYSISASTGSATSSFTETNLAGPANQMAANAGTTPQSAAINTVFLPLAVTVKDASNNPVSGVTVTFTAPGSGASGTFSNSTATIQAITNGSGIATVPFTANSTVGGPYTVTAAASGLTTVNFSLTNTPPLINYNTTGSTLSCNGVAGCVQNTTTSVTIGGMTFTYNAGSGSNVKTPSIINYGNIVTTGTAAGVNVSGLLLTINVNSTPPGASGSLPSGSISGSVSTSSSGVSILFSPNNTISTFGTLPGVVISGGGNNYLYQVLNPSLGLQSPTIGNPVGQTTIQGAVSFTSGPIPSEETGATEELSSQNLSVDPLSPVNADEAPALVDSTEAATAVTVNYNTTGSTLSCNGVAGCVQNTTTSVTIGGMTFTYNSGSGSNVATPSIINLGNVVTTGAGTNIDVTGMRLTINVNSTPPGAGGALPGGSYSGTVSTNQSLMTISFGPNNTTTPFGTLPGVIIAGGGQSFTYQVLNPNLGLQAPTIGNPIGQTSIQGAVTNSSPASMTANAGTTPQSATINTAFTNAPAVTVLDAGNNPVSGVSVTFTAPAIGASGVFSNSTNTIPVVTNASGVASAPFTANSTAGSYSVTASSSGLTSVNFALTNTPGAPSSMTANAGTTPQSAMVNTAFSNALAVTVKDAGNNPISGISVTFTAPASGASGTFGNNTATITVVTNSSGMASAPFTANSNVGAYTVTAAASGLTTVNFQLTNTGGPATHFVISAPTTATAGVAFSFTVTALDAGNNVATGYTGTVHFTSTGSAPTLPPNTMLVNGVGTFGATLYTAGIQSISAYDTVNFTIVGNSNNITVSPANAYSLKITAPANVNQGAPFSFTVTAVDAFNNPGASGTGTLHFTSTDGGATLPADTILVNGTGTFSSTLRSVGVQTITAADVSLAITGTSNNINVGAVHFAITAPATAAPGVPFSFTVTAQDQFTNTVTTYPGTVHFTSSDGSAVLPANITLTNGIGTFNATLNTVGIQTISATDTGTPQITGTSNNINVIGGVPVRSRADFDGDGRTDVSVFRPSEGNWYIDRSTAGHTSVNWGTSTDKLVPGDYDGDGKADFAMWRPTATDNVADFYVLNSSTSTYTGFAWGLPGDIPVPADYDGDGTLDIAIYRPSTQTWWIWKRQSQMLDSFQFGAPGDVPLIMDFNGDGKTDLAVYRPSDHSWYMNNASGTPSQNYTVVQFGLPTDIFVPADYDGDNKEDVAVFRPSDGTWYIRRSSDSGLTQVQFGLNGDIAVPGDYDGDGRDDIAVFRPSSGTWYLLRSTTGFAAQAYGISTDLPIPAAYRP